MRHVGRPELRQCLLAVTVLMDIDITPVPDGFEICGTPPVHVRWRECRRALGGAEPATDAGRRRLARWLLRRRWIADHSLDSLAARVRPLGLPVGHALHPGAGWARSPVLGGVLELGLGVVGLQPGHPERVTLVPDDVLSTAGVEPAAWWAGAQDYLDRMGALAAERLSRDSSGALRPMGDCDVVTLLGSAAFRGALCGGAAGGLRPAVVPMRDRGWVNLSAIDPAFAPAAAAATKAVDRGFPRPLLVTRDSVDMVAGGGRPQRALREPALARSWDRRVIYR